MFHRVLGFNTRLIDGGVAVSHDLFDSKGRSEHGVSRSSMCTEQEEPRGTDFIEPCIMTCIRFKFLVNTQTDVGYQARLGQEWSCVCVRIVVRF